MLLFCTVLMPKMPKLLVLTWASLYHIPGTSAKAEMRFLLLYLPLSAERRKNVLDIHIMCVFAHTHARVSGEECRQEKVSSAAS